MKVISKEKAIGIANLMASLQQPFEYVMGASLVIAQDQCFHFNTSITSFIDESGVDIKSFRCYDCGKVLKKEDLSHFMI